MSKQVSTTTTTTTTKTTTCTKDKPYLLTELPAKNSEYSKYFIRKADGGLNPCIDVTKESDNKVVDQYYKTLSNCVGFAVGWFNIAAGEKTCKWLGSRNAKDLAELAKKQGLIVDNKPTPGSCMVFGGVSSKYYGHIQCVLNVNSDGSLDIIDSAYNTYICKRYTVKNTNGNWGRGCANPFLGFVHLPGYQPEADKPFGLDVMLDNKKVTIKVMNQADTNYIRLRDVDEVLKLCTVDYDDEHGPYIINWKNFKKPTQKTGELTLPVVEYTGNQSLTNLTYGGENYIKLRELDTKLGLCSVDYDGSKNMVIIKTK